eukprot:CAMPEP_0173073342 /NCGR_PEP_ID=MMETSP1102-20130122/10349_1 /TAXON_ID=49646 /ORGANISM="Geminigera sp., Strain Caron Lab Isolate" /LENGTH=68 /DNA_ID=CAMNT_0013942171 /DNA_START=184 /DNA_END=390 /DNA_ORIENTATION=+
MMQINVVDSATPRRVRLFHTTRLARFPQHPIGSSSSEVAASDELVVGGRNVSFVAGEGGGEEGDVVVL